MVQGMSAGHVDQAGIDKMPHEGLRGSQDVPVPFPTNYVRFGPKFSGCGYS